MKDDKKNKKEHRIEEELNDFSQEIIIRDKKKANKGQHTQADRRVIEENKKTVAIPYVKGANEAIPRVIVPLAHSNAISRNRN